MLHWSPICTVTILSFFFSFLLSCWWTYRFYLSNPPPAFVWRTGMCLYTTIFSRWMKMLLVMYHVRDKSLVLYKFDFFSFLFKKKFYIVSLEFYLSMWLYNWQRVIKFFEDHNFTHTTPFYELHFSLTAWSHEKSVECLYKSLFWFNFYPDKEKGPYHANGIIFHRSHSISTKNKIVVKALMRILFVLAYFFLRLLNEIILLKDVLSVATVCLYWDDFFFLQNFDNIVHVTLFDMRRVLSYFNK